MTNYSTINIAPGMAFIDFGFLELGMLAALQRVGKHGGKLPERLDGKLPERFDGKLPERFDGKLAVRVAMGYDVLAALHQQLGQALAGLSSAKAEQISGTKKSETSSKMPIQHTGRVCRRKHATPLS